MQIARNIRPHLTTVALALTVAACASDAGTAPATMKPAGPDRLVGSFGSVFNVQLRTLPPNPILPPSPIYGFGNLQLRLGSLVDNSCLPPNPITPQPGTTLLSVCGKIFNEGGALYRGGEIYRVSLLGDGDILVASFGGALPPNPCRRYELAGAVTVSDEFAADMIVNPTRYQVRMLGDVDGSTTRISGLFDGSAWGSVGTRPETDPYFAEKVCTVAITP
jgi:hypothetical protein